MQITRQADYAVRAVLYLARQENSERSATSTVAEETTSFRHPFWLKLFRNIHCRIILPSRGVRAAAVTLAREAERHYPGWKSLEAIDGPIQLI